MASIIISQFYNNRMKISIGNQSCLYSITIKHCIDIFDPTQNNDNVHVVHYSVSHGFQHIFCKSLSTKRCREKKRNHNQRKSTKHVVFVSISSDYISRLHAFILIVSFSLRCHCKTLYEVEVLHLNIPVMLCGTDNTLI